MATSLVALRPPLIDGEEPPLFDVGITPGASVASENGLRPFSGRSTMRLFSMVWLRVELVVSRVPAAPLDGDGLGRPADFEDDWHRANRLDVELDLLERGGLEAVERHDDAVGAGLEVGQHPATLGIGRQGTGIVRSGLDDRDLSARQHAAG